MITLEEFNQKYKKMIIWGAGSAFLHSNIRFMCNFIIYIVDGDAAKWDKEICSGFFVRNPRQILDEDISETVVVICSQYENEIFPEARKMGINCDIYSINELPFYNESAQVRKIPIPIMHDSRQILLGKTALITGGSSGIGFGIAKEFLQSGCKVILAGTNNDKLTACLERLDCEERVRKLVLDVTNTVEISSKIEEASLLFENSHIDILVNSAGKAIHSKFFDIDESEYNSVMDVNTRGTFFMCQSMGDYMIKHKIKGHILNISSAASLRPAWTPYQISKWAIKGFTLGLADLLLPHGIIVNAIAPGPVATPLLGKGENDSIELASPSGRYALPCEISALAAFMVSDFGNLIVGDTFYITGGGGTISLHR